MKAKLPPWTRFCGALALAAAALSLTAASATAEIPFCSFGSAPGQCNKPSGVAVDTALGRVYVADTGNDRVNAFDEEGVFLFSFGSSGSGSGQFQSPRKIAVDNDPASPAFHNVYVVDGGLNFINPRVQRFDSDGVFILSLGENVVHDVNNPVAVGSEGSVYVGDDNHEDGPGAIRQIKRLTPTGTLLSSSSLPASTRTDYLVVDSAGNAYAGSQSDGIAQYELSEPAATLLNSFDLGSNTTALAIDSEDHLYAGQGSPRRFITKRDSTGIVLRRFGYDTIGSNLRGLAIGVGGQVFGSTEDNVVVRISEPPPGPVPCCLKADLGNTKATLNGQVNPEGKEATYHFEYLSEAEYEANGNDFEGPNEPAETPESAPVGSDFELHPAEAETGCATPDDPPQLECLTPGTAYRYRLVATNADGKTFVEGQFTTKRPFELLETYATEAGTDSVRLNATVNPLGIPATAYFEYVDDAAYQADLGGGGDGFADATRTPTIAVGSGSEPKAIAAQLSGLTPDTTYHYRATVSNASASETGPERTVSTFPLPNQPSNSCPNAIFRTGPSAFLPDCRAYEMVSPVDKNGGDIKVLVQGFGYPARLDQAADSGGAFTYSSVTAFAGALSAPWSSQYMARRGSDGWSTEAINPPRLLPSLANNPILRLDSQYRMFSPNLDEAWLSNDANPPLDECAPDGFINLYHRDNTTGAYEALIPRKPANLDKIPDYRLELQGLSADGTHAVFRANAKLTKDASSVGALYQIYEHIRDPEGETCGTLRLISVGPDGKAGNSAYSVGTGGPPAEYREGAVRGAVSADGSRIFFSGSELGTGPLYVRVNADQPQSEVSAGQCSEPAKACTLAITTDGTQFWGAPPDGSKVIYSIKEKLFEFDVDKAIAGETAHTLIASSTKGVAGISNDASRIYFVSTEEIGSEGETGQPNLYLYEPAQSGAERYQLVATLDQLDLRGFQRFGLAAGSPSSVSNGVRLSPDGRSVAFVANARLTEYDTIDAASGAPTIELYLYEAEAGQLRCVSCNPSGARPQGRKFQEGTTVRYVSAMMPPAENQTLAPRVLSADGNHLFFESFEALLPRDTNGKADAYEWERAANQAACDAMGAELYVERSGGCLSLISTGKNPNDTEIADATPDGSSVFLRTAESLLPQDPGQVDVYVARVNGGFPQPPGQPAACEGEACQGPIVPPDDPTPGSLLFQGAGNITEKVTKPKPRCPKGKVRRKGRCVKKKHHGHSAKAGRPKMEHR